MGLKFARWVLLVAGLCATSAVLTLPFPTSRRFAQTESESRFRTEQARFRAVSRELDEAIGDYRAQQARRAWGGVASADGRSLYVDASVPAGRRPQVDSIVRGAWDRVGAPDGATRAAAFVYYDTTALIGRGARADVTQRGEIMYLVPPEGSASRCVVIVRLGRRDAFPAAGGGLFGPCAFYAAFGAPGAGIQRWLARQDFTLATWSDWKAPVSAEREYRYGVTAGAARCLTGAEQHCVPPLSSGLSPAEREQTSQGSRYTATGVLGPFGSNSALGGSQLGRRERRYLADMARDIGPERFRRFWTSESGPEQAFAEATGSSLGAWTRQWLSQSVMAAPLSRRLSGRAIIWFAIALPLSLFAAARPRERVAMGR